MRSIRGSFFAGKKAGSHRPFRSLTALALAAIMVITSVSIVFASDEYPVREGDFDTPGSGDVLMGIEGTFVPVDEAAKTALLQRVNEIRKEACDEGIPSPGDRNVALRSSDYVPIKWSGLIELVAAMRAAEASVYIGHARLSTNSSVFNNGYGVSTNGENLAWNWMGPTVDAILYGIEQWYSEKDDWIAGTPGAVTGHYTSMINPSMKYIGLAGFYNSAAKYVMTVTNQLSMSSGLNEDVAGIGGPVTQKTLVKLASVTAFSISGSKVVRTGETVSFTNRATVTTDSSGNGSYTSRGVGPLFTGITWQSSDPSVATVDSSGRVTAVNVGETIITASVNGTSLSDSVTLNVVPAGLDPDLRFSAASISLSDDLAVNFKIPSAPFTGTGAAASDPFVKISFRGEEYTISEFENEGSRYSFRFSDIAPHFMNENIEARLYATVGGSGPEPMLVASVDYSVVKYCKDLLSAYADTPGSDELKKLVVDTLLYGAAAQVYMGHDTDNLASDALTAAERAYGTTSGGASFADLIDSHYETIQDPSVTWETCALYLDSGIKVRMKFSSADISGLGLDVTCGVNIHHISSNKFESLGNDEYYVYFDGLNPADSSEICYASFRNGDNEMVSNTFRFSVDSCIYQIFSVNPGSSNLNDLLWALVYYCRSAREYVAAMS